MNQSWKNTAARFLTAQTISLFGSSLVQYAIVWYITLSTSSGRMLTISTVCGFAPQIAISLFAGVWIDRYDRKSLIMLSDTIIALSTLILAIAFLSGHRNIWLLFTVLMVRSAGTGIQTPAVNAVIPHIVPQKHLMQVNGIQNTLTSLIMFLSPAVSGAILSVSTLETTLFIDVFTALIGVGITSALTIPGYRKDMMAGSDNAGRKDGLQGQYQRILRNPQHETRFPLSENRFLCTASAVIPDSGAVPYQPFCLPDTSDGQPHLRTRGMAPYGFGNDLQHGLCPGRHPDYILGRL